MSEKYALLVGQSGGCTAVMNATLAGVIETARRQSASLAYRQAGRRIRTILGARHGVSGLLEGDVVRLDNLSAEEIEQLASTPAAALGSCRHRLDEREAAQAAGFLAENKVRSFVYIGGNDSAETVHLIHLAAARLGHDLRAVAAPKTIDNDLPETDHCPGYGSAARFVACVTSDAGMDTEAMRRIEPVKIIEVMGRNAGWLAASSVLAKRDAADAPQIVWPPELPFSGTRFIEAVERALGEIGRAVIVIAETIRDESGRYVSEQAHSAEAPGKQGADLGFPGRFPFVGSIRLRRPREGGMERSAHDGFGHARPIGAAGQLCELVGERLGVRARWDRPGTIQRMSSSHVSPVDLAEARMVGGAAVQAACSGETDVMVTLVREQGGEYSCSTGLAPLEKIVGRERLLPESFFDPDSLMPTEEFRRYALPLVGPGLPRHFRL